MLLYAVIATILCCHLCCHYAVIPRDNQLLLNQLLLNQFLLNQLRRWTDRQSIYSVYDEILVIYDVLYAVIYAVIMLSLLLFYAAIYAVIMLSFPGDWHPRGGSCL